MMAIVLLTILLAGISTDLVATLMWISGVGAPYVIGWVVSLLLENAAWWIKLDSRIKFVVPMILSVLVSIGATLLLKNAALIQVLAPWYTLIVGAIMAYLGTQQGYMATKKAEYGKRYKNLEKQV